MTRAPVESEELLRLARKAWPGETLAVESIEGGALCVHETDRHGGWVVASTRLLVEADPRALEALHAALKVLAGEAEDVAALLAERDRLLAKIDRIRWAACQSNQRTPQAILAALEDP